VSVELNPQQKIPAEQLKGAVFVAAGAGSGKTRMLTQRFVNAIILGAVEGWKPAAVDQILAITFTEKAAGELAERVRLSLASAGESGAAREVADAWISTIHALCSRLLRRHAFDADVDPDFAVADAVLTGELRAKAFEDAAAQLLGRSEGVQLFERYPFGQVFAAAIAITREFAVIGCGVPHIELEPAAPFATLAEEAIALFKRGCSSCELEYTGSSTFPQDHARECRDLLGRCEAIRSEARGEADSLESLMSLLCQYKPAARVLKEFFGEQKELRAALLGRVAASIVAPDAEVLRRLIVGYTARYEARKAELGVLDFDDLQLKCVGLLEANPQLAKRYSEEFRLVMVDEFQDTDALQLRLIDALSAGSLCTVGDENQSIYRFRGADVGVYRGRREITQAGGGLVTELDINYRSHPAILDFVNGVFRNQEYFGDALLRLKSADGRSTGCEWEQLFGEAPRAEVLLVDTTEADAAAVRAAQPKRIAQRLAELCAAGARPGDIAILLRRYARSHEYAEALASLGIPSVVVGGSRFYALPEVGIMRALTRAVANPEDDEALALLLASDFIPVSSDGLALLRVRGGAHDRRPIWRLLGDLPDELGDPDRQALGRLRGVVERARGRRGRRPLADILLIAVEEAGWDLRLLSEGSPGRDSFANVLKYARQAAAFEAKTGEGAAAFARHIDTREGLGDVEAPTSLADDASPAVRIMSIHASKGLEFPVVVVPDLQGGADNHRPLVRFRRTEDAVQLALAVARCDDGSAKANSAWFEAFDAANKEAEAAETDRLMYVAFTRAQEYLIVSGAMKMRGQRPSQASHQLAKLTRALQVDTPVSGPMDVEYLPPGSGARCRLRIVEPVSAEPPLPQRAGSADERRDAGALPPGAVVEEPQPVVRVPERLSYTLLNEFAHCPRRFYVERMLGMRPAEVRVGEDAGALAFGVALHSVLRLASKDGSLPAYDRVDAIGRHARLSPAEQSRLVSAATRYSESEIARRVASDNVVRRESPFALVMCDGFMLRGSIDLHGRTADRAVVVDYKSGESSADEPELRERFRLQAECYALALLRDGCRCVEVEFVRPEVLDEQGSMEHVRYEFTAEDEPRITQSLLRRYQEMTSSRFDPRSSEACRRCTVVGSLCPHAGRWGADRKEAVGG
jgi:ATP-dependent helicase/nuclease subunit A